MAKGRILYAPDFFVKQLKRLQVDEDISSQGEAMKRMAKLSMIGQYAKGMDRAILLMEAQAKIKKR